MPLQRKIVYSKKGLQLRLNCYTRNANPDPEGFVMPDTLQHDYPASAEARRRTLRERLTRLQAHTIPVSRLLCAIPFPIGDVNVAPSMPSPAQHARHKLLQTKLERLQAQYDLETCNFPVSKNKCAWKNSSLKSKRVWHSSQKLKPTSAVTSINIGILQKRTNAGITLWQQY